MQVKSELAIYPEGILRKQKASRIARICIYLWCTVPVACGIYTQLQYYAPCIIYHHCYHHLKLIDTCAIFVALYCLSCTCTHIKLWIAYAIDITLTFSIVTVSLLVYFVLQSTNVYMTLCRYISLIFNRHEYHRSLPLVDAINVCCNVNAQY